MKLKILTLFSLYLLADLPVTAQSQILIHGNFNPVVEEIMMTVYKPVQGYFNVFYPDQASEVTVENGEFVMTIDHKNSGFIRIQSKGLPKTYFYAEPGDTLSINVITEGEITRTIFGGSHSEVNNLLAERKLLNDGLNSGDEVVEILKSRQKADQILQELDKLTTRYIQPLEMLRADGRITEKCYQAFVHETEQKLLSWAGDFLVEQVKDGNSRLMELVPMLFSRYDPFNPVNFIATTQYSNALTKCILMQDGTIPSDENPERYWTNWNNKFGMVVSEIGPLDYAPDSVQMYFLGNSLLTATVFAPMSDDDFRDVYNAYVTKFPESPYIPDLKTYIESKVGNAGNYSNSERLGVFYHGGSREVLVQQAFISVDTVTGFQSLIKNYFRGSRVFVDFWATWCSPCIAEFQNEPELHKQLKARNIKILYVSIDNQRSVENWMKMVNKFELAGYHYLVNPDVYVDLNNWFVGIPRYMLFDENGNLLDDHLPRPSTGEELLGRIDDLIK